MSTAATGRILIVDDREDLARFCERELRRDYAIDHVPDGRSAQNALVRPGSYDAVLLDRDFSRADPARLLGPFSEVGNEGIAVLRWLRTVHADLPVIMVTGYREPGSAFAAAELGADYLAWSDIMADPQILRERLKHAIDRVHDHSENVLAKFREQGLIASSPAFMKLLQDLHRTIPSRVPILLLGETGTGKDTLAYAIHALGGQSDRPYVSVNVAALNPNIIESELFGHVRGAFTGANCATEGKLRHAHGGTLFLNEIADLPRDLQAKMLSALEQKQVTPVGAATPQPADFHLISATSQDLMDRIADQSFRSDLYYRIAWHTVSIPPLRERREDIPALVRAFVRQARQGQEDGVTGIAQEAVDYLVELPWQGNVRELRAVVEAAAALARYIITLVDVHLALESRKQFQAGQPEWPMTQPRLPAERASCEDLVFADRSYREVTEDYFRYLYQRTGGRMSEVARIAGIAKSTAYEWKERLAPPCPD